MPTFKGSGVFHISPGILPRSILLPLVSLPYLPTHLHQAEYISPAAKQLQNSHCVSFRRSIIHSPHLPPSRRALAPHHPFSFFLNIQFHLIDKSYHFCAQKSMQTAVHARRPSARSSCSLMGELHEIRISVASQRLRTSNNSCLCFPYR